MPYARTSDNVKLYYEEVGRGTPILFVHEFAGDHRSWEMQMRFFSRAHRCITYSQRGYPPSDVPSDGAKYSQDIARDDVFAVVHIDDTPLAVEPLAIDRYRGVWLS